MSEMVSGTSQEKNINNRCGEIKQGTKCQIYKIISHCYKKRFGEDITFHSLEEIKEALINNSGGIVEFCDSDYQKTAKDEAKEWIQKDLLIHKNTNKIFQKVSCKLDNIHRLIENRFRYLPERKELICTLLGKTIYQLQSHIKQSSNKYCRLSHIILEFYYGKHIKKREAEEMRLSSEEIINILMRASNDDLQHIANEYNELFEGSTTGSRTTLCYGLGRPEMMPGLSEINFSQFYKSSPKIKLYNENRFG